MAKEPMGVLQGTLELLALKTVAARGPVHGFEILDWIRRATGEAVSVEDGALYPALRRMEKRGWIESAWGISDKGRRARYYTLTPAGKKALARQEARWERYVEAVAMLSRAAGEA